MKKNIVDSHDPNQLVKTVPTASTPISRSSTNIVTRAISLMGAFVIAAVTAQAADPTDTFYGTGALSNVTSGTSDSAFGYNALFNNTTGSDNTATGAGALQANTTGNFNTATGVNALLLNTIGGSNTAVGFFALIYNTTGGSDTATGISALASNRTGGNNTANGAGALQANTTGNFNTATGGDALLFNTTGNSNTAVGRSALYKNTIGSNNVAIGVSAGSNVTTGSNNIDIGALGAIADDSTIRIGKVNTQTATYIQGIRGATVAGGVGVMVDSTGHLGTLTSSARYKESIQPMDKASEAILSLKPVTFRYKKELDPNAIPQFGLVAEQVEKVNPELVAYDDQGNPNTVRYEAVNAMLLNEFLKEHRKVEQQAHRGQEQDETIAQLRSEVAQQQSANAEQQKAIAALTVALKAQAAQIQKVSDQVRTQAAATRAVANN